MSYIRVLLAHPYEVVRCGLRVVLAADHRLRVIGEAGSPGELVSTVRDSRPDAVVVGDRVEPAAWRQALWTVAVSPQVPVIVLIEAEPEYPDSLPRTLVVRRVPESLAATDLVATVAEAWSRRHTAGGRQPPPDATSSASDAAGPAGLTPRELEVLACLGRGQSNAEIARALALAVGTVKVHLARIMAKTDARSRVDLVAWAFRSGVVR
jgi:DNA-binding NarL/FixJ family response regulator